MKENITMKFIILLSCSLFFVACKCQKKISEQKNQAKNDTILTAHIANPTDSSDAIKIEEAKINGQVLELKVSYGGGCEVHEFDLIGSSNISKSLPPIRSIQLIHRAHKDACKALLIKDLKFDLSSFAYKKESGSAIYLQLDGWEDKLLYIYP